MGNKSNLVGKMIFEPGRGSLLRFSPSTDGGQCSQNRNLVETLVLCTLNQTPKVDRAPVLLGFACMRWPMLLFWGKFTKLFNHCLSNLTGDFIQLLRPDDFLDRSLPFHLYGPVL